MWHITTFSGTVLEIQRFINTESQRAEHCYCNERRELWLSSGPNDERKFIIHTQVMPARKTHSVTLLVADAVVLALYNETTGASVNYMREDPPHLLHGRDIWIVALIIAAAVFSILHPGLAVIGVPAYLIGIVSWRAIQRQRLRVLIDRLLNELQQRQVVRPLRVVGRRP